MQATLQNIDKIDIDDWVGITTNKRVDKDKFFVTLKDVSIRLSDGDEITIEKGFRFDGSSVPRFISGIFPRYGAFMFAALIHDWMYVKDFRKDEDGVDKARKFADKEMLYWSRVLNDFNIFKKADNEIRYLAVRLFGKKIYKK